jgi:hypothetical protein
MAYENIMIFDEQNNMIPEAVSQLLDPHLELCESDDDINKYFKERRSSLNTPELKFEFLKNYMRMISYAEFGNPSTDDNLDILKEMFLRGNWRQLSDKYERIN